MAERGRDPRGRQQPAHGRLPGVIGSGVVGSQGRSGLAGAGADGAAGARDPSLRTHPPPPGMGYTRRMGVPGMSGSGRNASGMGMAAQGMTFQGMTPQGMTSQGMTPQGMTPQGMAAQGMTAQGRAAQGMAAQGMAMPGMGMAAPGFAARGMSGGGMAAQGLAPSGATAGSAGALGMAASRMAFQHPAPPPPAPAAFFPGSASLFEQLDKRVMVVLRDGRHLIGIMRSYDQFSNIVLEDTHERHFVGGMFGDISLGLYLVRGDALVLMGELDESLEETPNLRRVSADEIIEAQQVASAQERQDSKLDWLFQDLS